MYYEATIKGKNNLPQNTLSFSSIAKSIVKKLESMRDTSQWKQTYQAYIYAINKYQIPYFGHCKLDNLKDKYQGYADYVAKEICSTPAQSRLLILAFKKTCHPNSVKIDKILTTNIWCEKDVITN